MTPKAFIELIETHPVLNHQSIVDFDLVKLTHIILTVLILFTIRKLQFLRVYTLLDLDVLHVFKDVNAKFPFQKQVILEGMMGGRR